MLYNPDQVLLRDVLEAAKKQVDLVFIADNSTNQSDLSQLYSMDGVDYQKMPGNVGIAAAQNVGIAFLLDRGYTHVFFLDQDSVIEPCLVKHLIEDLDELTSQGILVGGVGPRAVNRKTQKEYIGAINKGRPFNKHITEVTELISSGTLSELDHFKTVGLFDESLFIDVVDQEWCWRAAWCQKLRFFVSERAHMSHYFGEGDHWFLVNVHKPTAFRIYYQYRNYVILLRKKYVPFYWKLSNGIKFSVKFVYFPLAFSPGWEYFKRMCKGLRDGLSYKAVNNSN